MDNENLNNIDDKKKYKGAFSLSAVYTAAWGFAALDRLIIAMMLPFIMPYFGLNLTQGGLVVTMMAVGFLVCTVIFGAVSDKVGRKKITFPAIIIFSILSCVTGFVNSIAMLFVVRTVIGGAEGAYNSTTAAHITEVAPPHKRGAYLGAYNSAFALFGCCIAPIYAMNVASRWGWQMACYLTIIPGVILAICAAIFVKESPRFVKGTQEYIAAQAAKNETRGKVSTIEVLKVRNVVVSILLVISFFVWDWSWLSFGTTYFTTGQGFTDAVSGNIMAVFGLGGFFGCIIMPRISDKVGRKTLPPYAGAISFVMTLLIIFFPHGAVMYSVLLFIAAFFIWGVLPSIMLAMPSESVKPEWVASALGLVLGFGEVIGISSTSFLGAIGDATNLTTMMFVASFGCIAFIIISFFIKETVPSAIARAEAKKLKKA